MIGLFKGLSMQLDLVLFAYDKTSTPVYLALTEDQYDSFSNGECGANNGAGYYVFKFEGDVHLDDGTIEDVINDKLEELNLIYYKPPGSSVYRWQALSDRVHKGFATNEAVNVNTVYLTKESRDYIGRVWAHYLDDQDFITTTIKQTRLKETI
jgi:hypothetical protein